MRTSSVAKETSRFFDNAPSAAAPLLLRRSTRSTTDLAARFSSTADTKPATADDDITFGSDIEDAIKSSSPSPPAARKRTATVVKRVRASLPAAKAIKKQKLDAEAVKIKTEETLYRESDESGSGSESESAFEEESPAAKPKPKPKSRQRKPARKTIDAATGAATVQPPTDWEDMYALVKAMRVSGPAAHAAVDTMGCERLANPAASARDRRFHTLVALMLSSQTKDTVNAEAMARLQAELPAAPGVPSAAPGLTLDNMLAVDPVVLNELIGKVGFHNNKTKYLKQAAVILRDQHGSDIPPTVEGLMSLPGVGPKMAHLCMGAENGWDTVTGIGVDVHVHRITNLWGWQDPATKTPEATRLALEAWLPRDRWKELNWLLVGLGQKVCLPVGRRCGDCELGLRGLCRAADRKKVLEGRRRRETENVKVEVKVEVKTMVDDEGDSKTTTTTTVVTKTEDRIVKKEEEWEELGVRDVAVNESVPAPPTKIKTKERQARRAPARAMKR
ncbi:DNA glycosylase [Lasiosphaeria miniovina]|uniref:Endonuclease III homolog n=1 Tax=Lasiosphaeria miniovina TaxID=1954250 RepID=A0AA40B6F3_9PEZI|nr:DNA glycosylase [Lasiosphaeria miniovina]KAK0728424.1 DNA glycosylase [Lasiosphaeria miniovina]